MEGECLALLGPNGSGKTTLLKALGGLLKPAAGSLLFLGEEASSSRSLRRRGVYLHQAPYILSGSVSYNLYYGARARGLPRGAADDGVREALSLLGLSGFERRGHRELSGGEAQRVALARAFAAGADVLLLDEPTASADAASARLVLEALRARRAAGAGERPTSGRRAIPNDTPLTYAASGVDIDAKMAAVARAKEAIRSTFTPGVLGDVGGFGGLFRPDFSGMSDPVLVASTDGVGSKIRVAIAAGVHGTVGQDIVNHCVNDILVQGARPLFFLDYVATGRMRREVIAEVIGGVAAACRENGCALLGGETAEMPGMYADGDYDLAGTIVGVVDRPRLLDGSRVAEGDLLLGLASSGLHTNGYSLARKLFFERLGLGPHDRVSELGATVAEALLAVHRSYLKPLLPLVADGLLSAMSHVTGGGFPDNLPRVLPEGLRAVVEPGGWEWPALFRFIREKGSVPDDEMLRVFNCGVGMVLFVPAARAEEVSGRLSAAGERVLAVGRVERGPRGVRFA